MRNYRTYPVSTEHFVEWFKHQEPVLWPTFNDSELRPPNTWMLIAETIGPWGNQIGDDWISKNNPKPEKGGE
jgi:hypothetical protein